MKHSIFKEEEGWYRGNQKIKTPTEEKLEDKLGVMCAIQIINSILGSTSIMVDSCGNISALRRALEQP